MMTEDWRILPWHKEKWSGIVLRYRHWAAVGRNDHDHCAFCWDKFAADEGCLHEGYCTETGSDWICKVCYNDFKERFGWRVQK